MNWNIIFLLCFLILSAISETPTTITSSSSIPTPSTIVDILSSDAQYAYFLRYLQRNEMIPVLNTLENVTLLAPVNSAFASGSEQRINFDNNELLRYVINQRVRVGYLEKNEVFFDTLFQMGGSYYSVKVSPDLESFEYVIDNTAAIVEADIYAKHQHSFIQAIDQLLPIRPSICDVIMDDTVYQINGNSITFVKQLFKSLFTDFNAIEAEENSIELKKKKNKGKKDSNLPLTCSEFLSNAKTFFIPTDSYIVQSLPELDRGYYSALYYSLKDANISVTEEAIREIKHDIVDLLENLMLNNLVGGVNGTSSRTYKSLNKKVEYNIKLNKGTNQLILNDKMSSSLNSSNIALSNGVIHLFDIQNSTSFFKELDIQTVNMNPRKALFALHFSNYVKELEFRSLEYLIDGSTKNQTILVDILQRDNASEDYISLANKNSFSSTQSLLYSFVDGSININEALNDSNNVHKLLPSKLCSKKRIGSCFKIKFSASYKNDKIQTTVNDEVSIIGEPVLASNDNIIYLIDGYNAPPSSFKHSLGDLISDGAVPRHLEDIEINQQSCLRTLHYLNQFDLFSLNENGKGYSVFLPCGSIKLDKNGKTVPSKKKTKDLWKSLGLILNYLESNPELFKDVIKGLFVEDTIYSDFGLDGKLKLISNTLRSDSIKVEGSGFDNNHNHLVYLNHTRLPIPLNSDILFNQGVIHIVNTLLLPEDFQVSLLDLIQTTEDSNYPNFSFLDLINNYPKLSKALGLFDDTPSPYSLLIPHAESMNDFNITSHITNLYEFLELHLIPNEEIVKLLNCVHNDNYSKPKNTTNDEPIIRTNHTDAGLICSHNPSNDKVLLRLQSLSSSYNTFSYNKDHEVRVLSHGCTSLEFGHEKDDELACVFLIDKPLRLDWLDGSNHDNFLHIHLGFVSVGIGIILGLIIFAAFLFGFILCSENSRKNSAPNFLKNNDLISPNNGSSFMRVRTDDDQISYDRGYETDVDMVRNENDNLLPMYGNKRRYRRLNYGATSTTNTSNNRSNDSQNTNGSIATAPRSIKTKNITNTLNRDRNLPSGF